jgi:general secretion pathway protein D
VNLGVTLRGIIALVSVVVLLSGCAAVTAYREGNTLLAEGKTDQGLAKLEEAVSLDPRNVEYRIALASRRASIVNQLIATADTARRDGRLTDAENFYRQVLRYNPDHPIAKQGLDALAAERRHRLAVTQAEELFKQGGKTQLTDALERLRSVIAENPNQKDAVNLKARIDETRAKELKPEAKLAASYRKPITLEFRDAPLKAVFDVIAKVSGWNFFFDKDIKPDL